MIDVGAHMGENSYGLAQKNPDWTVFAFEPNIKSIISVFGLIPNYVVVPMAVSLNDGFIQYYVNSDTHTNSTVLFNNKGKAVWKSNGKLETVTSMIVPSIRLDTFMHTMNIHYVDYLAIDTQGTDFHVVLSLGDYLQFVRKIQLNVHVTKIPLYKGAQSEETVCDYMKEKGFDVISEMMYNFDQIKSMVFEKRY
jgi:FkbM family methyltransferase